MNTTFGFSNNLLGRSGPGGYPVGQLNWASTSYTKTENTDITIVTDDGDRITISSDRNMEANYSSYSGLLRSGSSSVKAEGYSYKSQLSSNLTLSITGDLDSEEYDDIMAAVKTIESAMEGAFSGNMDDMQSMADKFKEFDSLSGLSASIKIEESVNYEQGQAQVSGGNDTAGKDMKGLEDAKKIDHALDRIMGSGKEHGKAYGRVRHLMNDYLSGLLDLFSKKAEKNLKGSKAGETMKNMIMNRLGKKAETGSPA